MYTGEHNATSSVGPSLNKNNTSKSIYIDNFLFFILFINVDVFHCSKLVQ